eukprot:GHVH01004332.1.p1 GENE.GHVH01004332.1~~GHVH01004332.1.p1  ORF type:complete len:580 (+),score=40.30 GHVH01004332.1:26-1765(+)
MSSVCRCGEPSVTVHLKARHSKEEYDELFMSSHSPSSYWVMSWSDRLLKRTNQIRNDDHRTTSTVPVPPCHHESCKLCPEVSIENYTFTPPEYDGGRTDYLSPSDQLSIWTTLIGTTPECTCTDMIAWVIQPIEFHDEPMFCLRQNFSGPCGLLAAIQSCLIVQLCFSTSDLCRYPDYMKHCKHIERYKPDFRDVLNCRDALDYIACEALGFMIYQCASSESYSLIQLVEHENVASTLAEAPEKRKTQLTKYFDHYPVGEFATKLFPTMQRHRFSKINDLILYLFNNRRLFLHSRLACLNFVLSLIWTRGTRLVRADSDLYELSEGRDVATPLITRYGHTSQELVNLASLGQAISNLQDGEEIIPSDGGECNDQILLKGIGGSCMVGQLSVYASDGMLNVGKKLRYPVYPVWIAAEYSHYRVLYCPNPSIIQMNSRGDKAMLRWNRHWLSYDNDGLGFITVNCRNISVLEELLMAGIGGAPKTGELRRLEGMVRDEILLKSHFMQFVHKHYIDRVIDLVPLVVIDGKRNQMIGQSVHLIIKRFSSDSEDCECQSGGIEPNIKKVISTRWSYSTIDLSPS